LKIIEKASQLRPLLSALREQGLSYGFVPTMGNLHAGHLALVDAAAEQCDRVVVSIFINPLQFGPDEDLEAYPCTPEDDEKVLIEHGTSILYRPTMSDVYPVGLEHQTRVEVPGLSEILCGSSRPGHFSGVATVVNRLFNQMQADKAFFGKKDYQQYLIIKKMVSDLAMNIEVVGVDTVRLDSGLAMSSRNSYLSASQLEQASGLYLVLQDAVERYRRAPENYRGIIEHGIAELKNRGFVPDYLTIRRQSDLKQPGSGDVKLVVLAAAWFGNARLIDNLEFVLPSRSLQSTI
jgi:pantoate--beta-alanine ligase